MTHEDQTLKVVNDAENRQTLLYGMGDLHLEVVTSRLLSEYKAGIKLSQPKVAYRETIQKTSHLCRLSWNEDRYSNRTDRIPEYLLR